MTAQTFHHSRSQHVTISCTDKPQGDDWDEYVNAHENGSFFHLSGWGDVACEAYGYEPLFLTAKRGGIIAGLMLLIDVRTPLLGRSLVSTAFTVGGGPLSDDPLVANELLAAAAAEGAARNARFIESRSGDTSAGWLEKPVTHANFSFDLINDESEALTAVPRKRRAEIRKGLKAAESGDLTIRHDGDADVFYALYAKSLHGLGTPVFPKKFLNAVLNAFSEELEITVVSHRGAPICALLTFYHGRTALPYYVGAGEDARNLRAFDFLYWSVMRRAAAKGCCKFDFGRSKINSGAYKYKTLWGIEPEPLIYHVKLIGDKSLPDISASNPKFSFFTKTWKHLPLAVANRMGPILAPNFP
ncbi:FemAB family XrtA/PEP-CTERM system-associated protein [Hyphococcus sp.]|uniref:FemAB family XrtA/PEP-CTERM system-associated protein n=1 Tax=Hyphococcus sp. TaxID=2038636 RepID=UPI003CCC4117